jgi:hypothetical protein
LVPFPLSAFQVSAFQLFPQVAPAVATEAVVAPDQTTADPFPNKHEGETASWAGNSPNVIHRHYKALVKEADAKEFWEITPDNVAQIIPMPTTATAAAK